MAARRNARQTGKKAASSAGKVHHVVGREDLVPVRDLSHHGRVWLVSVRDGKPVVGCDGVRYHGVCLPYSRPISAVFVHDDRVWLQVGRRRWDIDAIRDVRQVNDTRSKAT